AEARLRFGRDLNRFVRVGLDGQARFRAAGEKPLPGDRTWDIVGGPQFMVGVSHFYGALTVGPATMGVNNGIGWTGGLSVAATTYWRATVEASVTDAGRGKARVRAVAENGKPKEHEEAEGGARDEKAEADEKSA